MDRALRQMLGGHSTAAFLRRHWQKEALLVAGALPGFEPPLSRDALFALAGRDDVQSRLVQRTRTRYTQDEGPFRRRTLDRLPARNWTLLVHGVNGHVEAADALLRRFSFIPYARLDDLMVSYAAPGGGVGPHYDSYDVFLLQASGRRRWRFGRQQDLSLMPDLPLRILARFAPQHDATLGPGDMLYLPPHYAHDGVAVDVCMTCSIGFRAPSYQELAEAFLDHLRDSLDVQGRYADPDLRPTREPARIGNAMRRRVAKALASVRFDADDIGRFLGRHLSEPRAEVVFTPAARRSRADFARRIGRAGIHLDPRTQLLYDDARLYVNGEDRAMPAEGADALRALADRRALDARECSRLPKAAFDLLFEWHGHGFLDSA
jgi:50S ribosomal protein L16 3-hydroxylase